MHQYILKRTGYLILTLIFSSIFTFTVINAIPGEPAEVLAKHLFLGLEESAPPELIEEVAFRYDLNRPLLEQYFEWIQGFFVGDLGNSILYHKPVTRLLALYLPPTLILTCSAMTFAIITGLILGVLSAIRQNTLIDHLVRFLTIFCVSMPAFWVAVMLVLMAWYYSGCGIWLSKIPYSSAFCSGVTFNGFNYPDYEDEHARYHGKTVYDLFKSQRTTLAKNSHLSCM